MNTQEIQGLRTLSIWLYDDAFISLLCDAHMPFKNNIHQ